MEWKAMQKQLQTEKERAEKMAHRIQDVNRQDLETKKLLSQLEAAKVWGLFCYCQTFSGSVQKSS